MRLGAFDIGTCIRPADGFACGGDVVISRLSGDVLVLAVIDVLGHGTEAHAVASRAEARLLECDSTNVQAVIAVLEAELSDSVGAAVGVATIHAHHGTAHFAGIGNIVARLFGRSERRLVSVDGIVGQRRRSAVRPHEFTIGVAEVLVLHTDGVTSRFSLGEYPQLISDEPSIVSREVVRRFGRTYDDAACIITRRLE